MSVIDSSKIVEILFDNSEEVPNDIYVNVMNMMKRHHEFADNEEEIRSYLSTIDKKYLVKFEKYLNQKPPLFSFKCECRIPSYFHCHWCFGIVLCICFLAAIIYCIASRPYESIYGKPPPINITNENN